MVNLIYTALLKFSGVFFAIKLFFSCDNKQCSVSCINVSPGSRYYSLRGKTHNISLKLSFDIARCFIACTVRLGFIEERR